MIHGIHGCHHGQQNLCSTNIRRRFFAADVLLTGLQCQTVSRIALCIDGHANQTTRHAAFECIAGRHITCVRTAESQRYAKTLAVTHHHISTPLTRRCQQCQRQQISSSNHHTAFSVDGSSVFAVITDITICARILQQHAEAIIVQCIAAVASTDFNAQRLSAGVDDLAGLRQHISGDIKHIGIRFADTLDQRHRFGSGGAFIQHRCIGDIHRGQIGDHGLEIQHCFQTTLRNLWLVRRVSGVPGWVFKDIAQNHARRMGVVITLTNQGFQHLVFTSDGFQLRQCLWFGFGCSKSSQRQNIMAADIGRHDRIDQRIAVCIAKYGQHLRLFSVGWGDMARNESVMRFQLSQ